MGDGDTLLNGVIGGVVGVLLFFLPFSPALGGAVAGYLQNRGTRDGAVVGGLSGVIAAIPGAVIVVLGLSVFTFAGFGTVGPRAGLLGFLVVFLFVGLAVGVYTILLGAIGGAVGGFVREEYDAPPPGELLGSHRDTTTPDTDVDGTTDTDTTRTAVTDDPSRSDEQTR